MILTSSLKRTKKHSSRSRSSLLSTLARPWSLTCHCSLMKETILRGPLGKGWWGLDKSWAPSKVVRKTYLSTLWRIALRKYQGRPRKRDKMARGLSSGEPGIQVSREETRLKSIPGRSILSCSKIRCRSINKSTRAASLAKTSKMRLVHENFRS